MIAGLTNNEDRVLVVIYVLAGGRAGQVVDRVAVNTLARLALAMDQKTFEESWGRLASDIANAKIEAAEHVEVTQ